MTKRPPKAYREEILEFSDGLKHLIKKGKTHGFITAREILQADPLLEDDIPQLDAFFVYCAERGIEVQESPNRILQTPVDAPAETTASGKKKTTRTRLVRSHLIDEGPTREEVEEEEIPNLSDDSVRMYLREIGRIPLLNTEEEIKLAKRIEHGDQLAKKKLVGSSRVDLQACKLEYSIVSPK